MEFKVLSIEIGTAAAGTISNARAVYGCLHAHIWHILHPEIEQHLAQRLPLWITPQRGDATTSKHVFQEKVESIHTGEVVPLHPTLPTTRSHIILEEVREEF